MAFVSTASGIVPNAVGDRSLAYGTYEDQGNKGGDIDTQLTVTEVMILTRKGSVVGAHGINSVTTNLITTANPLVNETLPASGATINIVCGNNDAGYWIAYGY